MTLAQTIATNLETIRKTIEDMAKYARVETRPSPELIAVSKRQPDDRIDAALEAGLRIFGENKVQEAAARWTERKPDHPDLVLHLIGPLQTNKAKDAVRLFDVIQTVDRPKLVNHLARAAEQESRCPDLFIQVNTGAEPQKAGVLVPDLPDLVTAVRDAGLPLCGLMCIPPVQDDPALHFALLKKLAGEHDLPGLSMGMSGDYALAAVMGATHIRVGTALFGERPD